MPRRVPWLAVVGPGDATPAECFVAEEVGAAIADAGALLVCGGMYGVMEAACRGARSRRGTTIGLLPGEDRDAANGWVELALPTGLGEGRNVLVVRAADAVVAVGGSWGTLTEVAFAARAGKPVVGLGSWSVITADGTEVPGVQAANDAREAVQQVLEQVHGGRIGDA